MKELQSACDEIIKQISTTNSMSDLESLKSKILGKSGIITEASSKIASMPIEERKTAGAAINNLKNMITEVIADRKNFIETEEANKKLSSEKIDVSIPPIMIDGSVHPITKAIDEIASILASMGFETVFGPEIEDDWYNFEALNIPEDHPARSMQDTFYIEDKVMRTHTSNVQIRTMKNNKPPFRVTSFGRVYRSDDIDMTHAPMFHQIEALCIDKDINLGHLKYTLLQVLKGFFEKDNIEIRMRPSFFGFTEPSVEVDMLLTTKTGQKKWLEVLGAGMVHPKVLENCGIDSKEYQGFAFGMGIERLAMIKYGVTDIRAFYEGNKKAIDAYNFSWVNIPKILGGF